MDAKEKSSNPGREQEICPGWWAHNTTIHFISYPSISFIFSPTNSHEANWQPTTIANNTRLLHNPQPKFLGVTLDRLLTLGLHIKNISTKAAARCRVLASLTSKEWGWRKDQLLKVYKALQFSLLTYVAPVWQPWVVPSRIDQLERCQNKSLRVVTIQIKSTQLKRSDGRPAFAAFALAYEKAHRLPPYHSRRQILAAPSRHRLKRSIWRSAAQVATGNLPAELNSRTPIGSPFSCLWEDSSKWNVHDDNLAPPVSQDDATPYLSFIRHLNVRLITYTDDSATAGQLTVARKW